MARAPNVRESGLEEAARHAASRVVVPPSLRAEPAPSWLGQVQRAHESMPAWFTRVASHPMFFGLDRATESVESGWRITTREELEFQGASMRDVFQAFADHYKTGTPR